MNTIIGKICAFPAMKATITKSARIVTYFNSSHYWGGQLESIAATQNVTHSLKTNTETQWYSLILQALSLQSHR